MGKITRITDVGAVTLCQFHKWQCLCEREYLELVGKIKELHSRLDR